MKRKDIKVGVEYLVSGNMNWANSGPYSVNKMTAVDTEQKWAHTFVSYNVSKKPKKTIAGFEVGDDVLIDSQAGHVNVLMCNQFGQNVVISVNHIRATWEEGAAQRQTNDEAAERGERERQDRRRDNRQRFNDAYLLVATHVPGDVNLEGQGTYRPMVHMPLSTFEALTRRASQG